MPDSGVKEANTPELKALIEEVGDYQAMVSIDWITQCIEEDERVSLDHFRITLPSAKPAPVEVDMPESVDRSVLVEEPEQILEAIAEPIAPCSVETAHTVKVEARPAPSRPNPTSIPIRLPSSTLERSRTPSYGAQCQNAIAGPSRSRQSTAPREVIKIEDDDDDDDCIVLDYLQPKPTTKRTRAALGRNYPLAPPQTPMAEGLAADSSAEGFRTQSRPGSEDDEDDEDSDDDVPLRSRAQRLREQWKYDSSTTDPAPRLITNPAERERMVAHDVMEDNRQPFEQLEAELHIWAQEGFLGTFKAFWSSAPKKVSFEYLGQSAKVLMTQLGDSWNWQRIFKHYRREFERVIPGLYAKGNPDKRGPKRYISSTR